MKAKWISGILSSILLLSLISPAAAEEKRTLQDESIYDVLVDRYFNKQIQNDYEVDATDPSAFNGGDFEGLTSEIQHIKDMGFTVLSIGPVFASDTYDGKEVIDYHRFDRHFGTEEEFQDLIDKTHELDMKVMIDIPTQKVSGNHIWTAEHPDWFIENEDGTMALDTANAAVQQELIGTFSDFVKKYKIDGLRLQTADELDPDFVSAFSEAMKDIRDVYILSDRAMEPMEGLDAVVLPGVEETLRNSYKNFDQDTSALPGLLEKAPGHLIQVDSLLGSRFTADMLKEKGFPPTRWRLLFSQLLTMPGIPVIQYGSEIAMNGTELPESHQIMDLSVEEELINHIADLNSLRNSSEALRTGETEVLHEEDGWFVYKRSNEEESWIIAINNTSSTQHLSLSAEVIGNDKEMRGLFESDVVRQEDNGEYRITLDRELAETYHVTDERGLNTAYLIALALVFVLFLIFLWIVWRKGKQRKADEAAKQEE